VVVRVSAGPAWAGGPPEDQPGWDAHATFIDDLVARGLMIMGGPYTDNSGTLMLFEGLRAGEVRQLLLADPFVLNGVFELEDVRDWTVYVDTRVE
jgi:uncharacterized protein YciI